MKLNDIIFKTKISDYFYVVTTYKGTAKKRTLDENGNQEEEDIYHATAYREIYTGPMGGVGDYAGTRIVGSEDLEGQHLEMCAIYKKNLEKGGAWEGQDRPLAEQYTHLKKKIALTKEVQELLEV